MLLCVCLNPALDVTYRLGSPVHPGESHRVREVRSRAGGKGVNVARVLRQLAIPSTVLALAGGADGAVLREELREDGVGAELVRIAGPTRRTLTVVDGERATAFNEPGPQVGPQEWSALRERFAELLEQCAAVVLSGSLPPGVPADAYAVLTEAAARRFRPVLLDADGAALREGLRAGPELVKPNLAEVRELLGEEGPPPSSPEGGDWLVRAGRRLVAEGAGAAVVSLGPDGLLATTGQATWRAHLAGPVTGNPTGAGDALVAALARGLVSGRIGERGLGPSWPELLRDAVATSAAAVARPVAGEIDPVLRAELAPTVVVQEIAPGVAPAGTTGAGTTGAETGVTATTPGGSP